MAITVQMRETVSQLYVSLFGRAPDGEGLGYWVGQLNAGKTMAQVADLMFATTPARAYYPSFQTNGEIIKSFYTNVFGVTTDTEGEAFWTAKLNGGESAGSVISQIIAAALANTATSGATAKATLQNKVAVAQWYGESNGSIAGATTILTGVTADVATVTAAKAGSVQSGQTFTLATSADAITGTSGNDKISGVRDATAAAATDTLTAADSIDGGEGKDTFTVTSTAANTDATGGAIIKSVEVVNLRQTGAGVDLALDASKVVGATEINAYLNTGTVTVTNLAQGASFGVVGNGSVALGAATASYAATATSATINVAGGTGATTAGAIEILDGAAIKSVTINADSATNKFGGIAFGVTGAGTADAVTSVTINAAGSLTTGGITGIVDDGVNNKITVAGAGTLVNLGTLDADVDTVDASGMTAGGVTAEISAVGQTITGGAGKDAITTLAAGTLMTKVVDAAGGATDTLVINAAALVDSTAKGAQFKNFEVLQVNSGAAGAAQSVSNLSANNTFTAAIVNQSSTDATGITNMNATMAAAVTVKAATGTGAITLGIKDATVAGNIDTIKVTLDDGAAAVGTFLLTAPVMDGIEKLEIVAKENFTVTALTAATALDSIKVTGAGTSNITTGAVNFAANSTFDFSAATGAVTFSAAAAQAGATATGLSIKGSTTAANGLSDSVKADVITGGAKADTLAYLGGADVVTLGAGGDVTTFDATAKGSTLLGNGATFKFVAGDSVAKSGATGAFAAGTAFDTTVTDTITGFDSATLAAGAGAKFTIDTDVTATSKNFGTSLTFGSTAVDQAGGFFILDNNATEAGVAYVFQDSNGNSKIDATDFMIKLVGTAQSVDGEFTVTSGNLVISTL
jgi:hypothetical protein